MMLAVRAALACLLLAASSLVAATGQPNVIIIVADDLGYADVGFRGSKIETPSCCF